MLQLVVCGVLACHMNFQLKLAYLLLNDEHRYAESISGLLPIICRIWRWSFPEQLRAPENLCQPNIAEGAFIRVYKNETKSQTL